MILGLPNPRLSSSEDNMANRAMPAPPSGLGYDPDTDLRWQPAPQVMTSLPSQEAARLSTGEPVRTTNDNSTVHVVHPNPPIIR